MMPAHKALVAALLLLVGVAWAGQPSDVSSTRHNLTSEGPGPIRLANAPNVCDVCHTPHASNPAAPLWNRDDPGSFYQTYESSTLVAQVGQPTGSSRLCLSCHDGTIALNQTYNPASTIPGGAVFITAGDRGYIGTDLSDDHPISFVYDQALAVQKGQMRNPAGLPQELPLDHNQQLQCTTCHDPHDDTFGQFLRMDNRNSALCVSCHDLTNWATSAHATANTSLAGVQGERFSNLQAVTVAEAACESCHRPHTAGGKHRLLGYEAEESNCYVCHDGSASSKNVLDEFRKVSAHPVDLTTGEHDPTENPLTMNEHVECADCHNPHQPSSGPAAAAPDLKPTMRGASGLSGGGQLNTPTQFEYEVCYKCHSTQNVVDSPLVERVLGTGNLAESFAPTSASFHPVQVQGRSASVPSLIQPLEETSVIYCTDCHGSDNAQVRGPHGSTYRPLLQQNYSTGDTVAESPAAYALCYSCHDRNSILADASFPKHRQHIVDASVPCSVCHDPHGVVQNEHLINFDSNVVNPSVGGGPTYQATGIRQGTCTVSCHGRDHNNTAY